MENMSIEFSKELKERRQRLLDEMPASSIAIVPASETQWRNGDAEYPFRQSSDFYYLTGFCEPHAVMVLIKESDHASQYILFCQPSTPEEEVWTGPKIGLLGARELFSADKSFSVDELDERILDYIKGKNSLFYSLGIHDTFDKRIITGINSIRAKPKHGGSAPKHWVDLNVIIHRLRRIKTEYEINLMRKAADISANAHRRLMKLCKPGIYEYQLEAEFLHECYSNGVRTQAYTPIVAGGKNACILHYTDNSKVLTSGELVLVDAGCEYQYYASDITRTFPIAKHFSEPQRQVYSLVLEAQRAGIEAVRPGGTWDKVQSAILSILVKGLCELRLLQGDVKELIEQKAYLRFYMHSAGHWLGLDVHDVGEYKIDDKSSPFEPGMVLTVEPGLYIAPHQKDVDKKWWGIGIRIEDDILVTPTGHEVLSHGVPKTIEEIEQIRTELSRAQSYSE